MPSNNSYTGYLGWLTLTQINAVTGQPTGVVVPNVPSDPNYVAPVFDDVTCSPVVLPTVTPTPTLTLTPTPTPPTYLKGGLKTNGNTHYIDVPYATVLDPFESVKSFTVHIDCYRLAGVGGIKLAHTQLGSTQGFAGFFIDYYQNGDIVASMFDNTIDPLGTLTKITFNSGLTDTRIKLTIVADIALMQWRLYINGDLKTTAPFNFDASQTKITGGFQLASYTKDVSYGGIVGYIFDFQYFSKALNGTEILNIITETSVPTNKELHLQFDEDTGLIATDIVANNHGTLFGYTSSQVQLGPTNHWVQENLNPKI